MQKALGFSTLMRLKPDAIPTIKAKKADTNDNNMEENLRKNSGVKSYRQRICLNSNRVSLSSSASVITESEVIRSACIATDADRQPQEGIYDYITIVNSEMSRSAYRKRNISRIVNEAFHEFESQNKADQEELTTEVETELITSLTQEKSTSCHIRPFHRSVKISVKSHMVESSAQTDFVSCEACNHPNNAFYYSNANDEEIVSDTDSITDDSSDEDYIAAEDSDFESDVEKIAIKNIN
uniref:Uncharacterized protein n=1 Tax=Strigamia maritima TaxID=126957 RepID=T1JEN0_STRMM